MFCPKCGTKNPDDGKFCRSCGTDLGVVTSALSGNIDLNRAKKKEKRQKSPDEVFAEGIQGIFGGLGFVAVALVLYFTGIIGGQVWWFWLLIPAGFMIGGGVAETWKAKRMEKRLEANINQPVALRQPIENAALPPSQTEYVAPDSRYRTGDLVPPSVTDNTTRHLEMDSEGETMTLPKKK